MEANSGPSKSMKSSVPQALQEYVGGEARIKALTVSQVSFRSSI